MDFGELKEKITNIEADLGGICRRLTALEGIKDDKDKDPEVLELDLTLPKADIDGLHFNETKVHAVFDKKDDGWYHSRDILFLSARNVKDDTSYDTLTKYLNSYDFRNSIRMQLPEKIFGEVLQTDSIEVSLPEENEGIKPYNGVDLWYWLLPRHSGSAAYFATVTGYGYANSGTASAVGGCAPVFRVAAKQHE
jgi:hypothetical protein